MPETAGTLLGFWLLVSWAQPYGEMAERKEEEHRWKEESEVGSA